MTILTTAEATSDPLQKNHFDTPTKHTTRAFHHLAEINLYESVIGPKTIKSADINLYADSHKDILYIFISIGFGNIILAHGASDWLSRIDITDALIKKKNATYLAR